MDTKIPAEQLFTQLLTAHGLVINYGDFKVRAEGKLLIIEKPDLVVSYAPEPHSTPVVDPVAVPVEEPVKEETDGSTQPPTA